VSNAGLGEEPPDTGDGSQSTIERLQAEMAELRSSRTRLLLAADADRRSIERTLHDGLQQQLVALAVTLSRVEDVVEKDPTAAKAPLDELASLLGEAIAEAAKLAQRIHPPRLVDGRGLASALRAAAADAGIGITVHVSTVDRAAPEMIAEIHRCCAEALSAAPSGTQATVSVFDVEGGVRFEVGVAGTYSDGLLDRLRDRVEALGGRLGVVEAGDGGSRVAGTVPPSWS
jgi:signal transduction histidine kinase